MDPALSNFLLDWFGLLGRWVHIITGIAWIGASFYFVWLDNHLLKPADGIDSARSVAGELWAVHGGGFYHSQKYRAAPGKLPGTLHWFYKEAYASWISGFFLLSLIYYAQADLYLIDPSVAALSKPVAISISIGFLFFSWLIYNLLCRSPLGKDSRMLGALLGALLCAEAWALCHLFSGRGAFIQFGAVLGTIMVANVYFVIIPGQRELVNAKLANREPDPVHGQRGKQRSVHNTYFTLPVIFTMISHHYAATFGARHNWLVLIGISLSGVAIRFWFVSRHRAHERANRTPIWPMLTGIIGLTGVAVALVPPSKATLRQSGNHFSQVVSIFNQRCLPCHARAPTQPGFNAAPNGIMFDTPEQIIAMSARIQQQLMSRAMPVGNITKMTESERAEVLAWIESSAHPK